jgi:hypothetical protein
MAETRRVVVEWHDQPGELFETTVAIDDTWPEYEDDVNIFFYFRTFAELEDAKTGEGYEFRIVEVEA